jgi:hypothetical protein
LKDLEPAPGEVLGRQLLAQPPEILPSRHGLRRYALGFNAGVPNVPIVCRIWPYPGTEFRHVVTHV